MIDKITKSINIDIEAVNETIETHLEHYQNEHIETVQDLVEDCMEWEGNDLMLSFEVGYLKALETVLSTIKKLEEE